VRRFSLAFPVLVAAMLLFAPWFGLTWRALIDLSIAAAFLLGFGSSFLLDGKPVPALGRGIFWTLLSLVLFAAKKLA
jgi:hypothetical protein